MTDSAGNADIVSVEAEVMPAVERPVSDSRRFMGMLTYGVVSIMWYFIVRVAILGVWSLPWWLAPKTPTAAALWMLFFEPIGLAIGAYATMLTNTRNRPFHTAITVIVFASIFFGHITWGIANPYTARAVEGLRATAWVFQAVFIAIGAAIGFAKTKPKEIRIPKMLLPPRMRKP